MDSLQTMLAGLGGLVLAGLVGHSLWQSRRAGSIRRAVPPHEPAIDPAVEPTLGDAPADAAATPAPAGPAGAPRAQAPAAGPAPVEAPVVAAPRRNPLRLDPLIDAMAQLVADAPHSGDQVLAHLPATRRVGSKPHWIEARNEASGEWEHPQPGRLYREFRAGVQLANRSGALNEIEYSEFVHKVQGFADTIGAATDFEDMLNAVSRARELDAFAGEHDAQLACRLYARTAAWSVGYIQQQALACGFLPGPVPGRLVMPGSEEGAPPVLTLQFDSKAAFADDPNEAAVHELVLSFDVPQTPSAEQPFDAWRNSAQALAAAMDAVIADDHGRPLTPESFEAIGRELGQLYDRLEARELAAGSPAARRLFS
ncbi:cell division protein ZipA C-terminal FtsZ-binding domain-containing protein [Caldimonas tepidiphila]|uniref:cell division protein ZipA C-terminal FtsZ-binding domain-containing protein n=1 Tax=Caldimonas tepidiphila TaxID=2315841 RepID=UPI000E5C0975|nr:cell division protein ZipA C-terminal FtsZ-binding domain-containing protein [Caldimonas tepidiphila]